MKKELSADVRLKVAEQVLKMSSHEHACRLPAEPGANPKHFPTGHPRQGQMVTTGIQFGVHPEKRIGFCVQVRLGRGQFGSDMVFLRHPDGSLTTHENQSYFGMSLAQEAFARQLFEDLPEGEDYTHGYKCCEKIHEVGFLITDSKSAPFPNTPFGLVINATDTASGKTRKTFIAHI